MQRNTTVQSLLERIDTDLCAVLNEAQLNAGAASSLRTARAGVLMAIEELPCNCGHKQSCTFCISPTWESKEPA